MQDRHTGYIIIAWIYAHFLRIYLDVIKLIIRKIYEETQILNLTYVEVVLKWRRKKTTSINLSILDYDPANVQK